MTDRLDQLCWTASELGTAVGELARAAGLLEKEAVAGVDSAPHVGEGFQPDESKSLGRRIDTTASRLGIEAEPLVIAYPDIEQVLRSASPVLIRVKAGGDLKFIAIASGNRSSLSIAGSDGKIHRVKLEKVRSLICQQLDASIASGLDQVLIEAGIAKRRRSSVRSALLAEAMRSVYVRDCWLLRMSPGANFSAQLKLARIPHRFLMLTVVQLIQYLLFVASWWVIGRGALQGRIDYGWLLAWMLLLFTMIPYRLIVTWLQGSLAIGLGVLLKQRLLYGAMRLDQDELRKEGSGQVLGRVIESAAVEALAATGGFAAMTAVIELLISAVVLGQGAGGWLHVPLLMSWTGITLFLFWRYHRQRNHWTEARLAMTSDMVERMVGHRTRLAQEACEHWHDGEDEMLTGYVNASKLVDRSSVLLMGLVPRGWLLLGLAALIPQIVSADTQIAPLAISIGGLLLGYQALGRLTGSLSQVSGAVIAWQQVADMFRAASLSDIKTPSIIGEIISHPAQSDERQKVIEGLDLAYRYRENGEPVLHHCSFEIYRGERILVEGASGEGKSTLISLLTGLRTPESGTLTLQGLDFRTLGSKGWRQRVAAAPQFHENHVLTGTLAFNLLLGRNWPAEPEDLNEAQMICEELGLSELLERMPLGLSQVVGETGWQLSHGERSRLYIARALLQGGDLIVFDESFAALDPENLRLALQCVLNRSRTLLVVAHP